MESLASNLNRVDAEVFVKMIQNNSDIKDTEVTGKVSLNSFHYKHPVKFTNCHFKDGVIISEVDFHEDLTIRDCDFDKEFTIHPNSTFRKSISIRDSDFDSVRIGSTSGALGKQKVLFRGLSLVDTRVRQFNLSFLTVPDGFNFERCDFSLFLIFHVSAGGGAIERCYFEDSASILFEEIEGDLEFVPSARQSGRVEMSINKVNSLRVLPEGGLLSSFTIANSNVDHFSLLGIIPPNSSVTIKDSRFYHFNLYDIISEGRLRLHNIQSKELTGVSYSTIKSSYVSFKNIDFGRTTFVSFNFNSFDTHSYGSCIIENIDIAGFHFPKEVKSPESSDISIMQTNRDLYEFYNRLYMVMKRQGDRFNELYYYASSLEYQRRYLDSVTVRESWWKRWVNQLDTRSILYLNKWSTNYGRSWIQGALVTLGVGIVLYVLYVLSFPNIAISLTEPDYELTNNLIANYFVFINPAHRYDFMDLLGLTLKPNVWSRMIDFLSRVIIGFMIYQTITASRRVGHR